METVAFNHFRCSSHFQKPKIKLKIWIFGSLMECTNLIVYVQECLILHLSLVTLGRSLTDSVFYFQF